MFHNQGGCSHSLSKSGVRGGRKKKIACTTLEYLSCEQWSEEPVSVNSNSHHTSELAGARRGLWECLKQWSRPQAAVLSEKHTGQQPALLSQATWTDVVVASLVRILPERRELGIPTGDAKVPAILHECNSPLK